MLIREQIQINWTKKQTQYSRLTHRQFTSKFTTKTLSSMNNVHQIAILDVTGQRKQTQPLLITWIFLQQNLQGQG